MDSRWNLTEDPLYGSASWDMSFGGAGGIVGHAKILFRRPAWIEDSLHVRSAPVASSPDGSWQSTFLATVLGPGGPGPGSGWTAGGAGGAGLRLHLRVCEDLGC